MLPINDAEPNRYMRLPYMTLTLIVVNTVILIWEWNLPWDIFWIVVKIFGSTPSMIWAQEGAGVISTMTSMFLHGDPFHLIGNMLFLWVFGRRVEDACGPTRFLLFYLLAGTSADLITALVLPNEDIPGIGASGAIFGVMGAYLLLFPNGRIRTLYFLYFIPTWPRFRAYWFIFYYLAIQIIPAMNMYSKGIKYGIGYWAHLGGFFACFFIFFFLRPEAFARYMSNVPV
ncbi:MAG TPA: rhomboid family intramembrane serine protease [Anaerolineales bacterium]|jgi:membrane associated rhomboid family serine protease|nr:rhomboid family intramembrane serine protease [Anaerolineales bacterium]